MGQPKTPQPVKLIVSAFAPGDALLAQAREALAAEWGGVDFESELLPFEHTTYYQPEFGAGLVRRIWTLEPLIDPGTLAAVKLRTNELEQRWAVEGRRRVNLDPGYLSPAKLVLATTKNHGHRIYLGSGIYAEVTLQYRDGAFCPWPWTYPDYATPRYRELFAALRQRYLRQLRAADRVRAADPM
jgi:hypothetical protein